MDDIELQRTEVNDRLAHAGMGDVSQDELKLISALLRDSLMDELESLKGRDLTYESKTEPDRRIGSPSESDTGECVICGSTVKDFGHYTIEFGSHIRKRANMCGLDCVSEFVGALRESKGL